MQLLIDIGNTRIKWAELTAQGIGEQHASSYAGWDRASLAENLLSSSAKPERVLVSNVGGDAFAQLLGDSLRSKWAVSPEFVRSTAQAAGVRNAYPRPEQLGVDRWLGVIAAHQMLREAVCIVGVGTAMTIDGVDAKGNHTGGVIVPGPELAIASLFKGTSDLALRSQAGEVKAALFADNTLGAIHQGVAHMLASLVEKSIDAMTGTFGAQPILVFTGGASDRIAPLVQTAHRFVPDLVLRGLAVLAQT